MTDKEKIKAEIKRLIADLGEQRDVLLEELLDFINNLSEDSASEDLEKDKEPTLRESFDELKRLAKHWGAAKADVKTDDGKWEYTIAVKRLKK